MDAPRSLWPVLVALLAVVGLMLGIGASDAMAVADELAPIAFADEPALTACDPYWANLDMGAGLREIQIRVQGLVLQGWDWRDAFVAIAAGECQGGGAVVAEMVCEGYDGTNFPGGCP